MSSEAKNLEAISRAIDVHNRNCGEPALAVLMNPFEVERLGWEDIRGVPIEPDSSIATGRFRIVCNLDFNEKEESEEKDLVDAVTRERDTVLV